MKNFRRGVCLFLFATGLFASAPAWAVNREMVELQTQVQQIQD